MPPAASSLRSLRGNGGAPWHQWKHLILVARADPIVCGHATETRHLAEAAMMEGFESVHIVTYPLSVLEGSGLPLKAAVEPYSAGIQVHRPEPVGDYKVLDGRLLHGLTGRLIEVLLQLGNVPTIVMHLYLVPHGRVVMDAVNTVRAMPKGGGQRGESRILTVAKACGSDITSQVATALAQGKLGAVHLTLSTFLAHDLPLAVSEYTKAAILDAARQVDAAAGTGYAKELARRVRVSYPPVLGGGQHVFDAARLMQDTLQRYGLWPHHYVLFLSRCSPAKGVADLVDGYLQSQMCRCERKPLIICTTGPDLPSLDAVLRRNVPAAYREYVRVISSVTDSDKIWLYHFCAAFVLPSKPTPAFTETFGICLAEKALCEAEGPTLATRTGGMPEATGGHCLEIEPGNPASITQQLDRVLLMAQHEKLALMKRAERHAAQFKRGTVFRRLLGMVDEAEAAAVAAEGRADLEDEGRYM